VSTWSSTKARRVYAALARLGWTLEKRGGSHRKLQKPGGETSRFAFTTVRKSGRRRWQGSQRIPGFVRKISVSTRCSEIDSAYQSLSLMQRYGNAGLFSFPIWPNRS
jgi:predicted RNA binding protein YcfA (HicA-like mRNA interferase family)